MHALPRLITSPKRAKQTSSKKDGWFDYYAGFSPRFVADVLQAAQLPASALVFDPWNGSGTTTATANDLGYRSVGLDINPVMVVVARAKLLTRGVHESLLPLAKELLAKASQIEAANAIDRDPLNEWFVPKSAAAIRAVADAISKVLTGQRSSRHLFEPSAQRDLSGLAAFYLVALFGTVRRLLTRFKASNPTWIKPPVTAQNRLRPTSEIIHSSFEAIVEEMSASVVHVDHAPEAQIYLGNSSRLPSEIEAVDAVISSPPYCTRIDYAVATKPELAILGCPLATEFHDLRQRLIGGTVISEQQPERDADWGRTCLSLLDKVRTHASKGSRTYYYKLFLQYFGDMYASLREIDRVLNSQGSCVLVVQDSHYKAEHVNVARILTDMCEAIGWTLDAQTDFPVSLLMARMNPKSRLYRRDQTAVESVLWFKSA